MKEEGGGERTEIGRCRMVGLVAGRSLNALIRRDVTVPKGSGGGGKVTSGRWTAGNGHEALKQPGLGQTSSGSGAEMPNGLVGDRSGYEAAGREH